MPDRSDLDPCARFADLAEAFVDGDLEAADDAFVRAHATGCAACAGELARARELVAALRSLPEQLCPPRVAAAVLAHAAEEEAARARRDAGEPRRRWLPARGAGARPRRLRWAWQAGLATAAAVALTVAMSLLLPRAPTPDGRAGLSPAAMTPAEAARAEDQVKLAFAYIGRVGREAGDRVTDEMIDKVFAPARRAFGPPEPASTTR